MDIISALNSLHLESLICSKIKHLFWTAIALFFLKIVSLSIYCIAISTLYRDSLIFAFLYELWQRNNHSRLFFNYFTSGKATKILRRDGLLNMKETEKTLKRKKNKKNNRIQRDRKWRMTLHLNFEGCSWWKRKKPEENSPGEKCERRNY